MGKLRKEEIVTMITLSEKGEGHCAIARLLKVSEGTVRYHLRRQRDGAADGRAQQRYRIEETGLEAVVEHWWNQQVEDLPDGRPPNCEALWDLLKSEHGYDGSRKSVWKYLRARFPRPKMRPVRRIETPPGAQMQTDWCEFRGVDIGDAVGLVTLYAFVMILSHSRKAAVVWCRSMDQLSWHRAHNEALKRLGGVAAVNRIDNLKTGIARGAGPWGVINEQYRRYARTLGFHVDACLPRSPQQKGKVERRCGILRALDLGKRCFTTLETLQEWSDQKLAISERERLCPATGETIADAWARERDLLRALPPTLPEPFDLVKTALVGRDCTIAFEGRRYTVPFAHVGRGLEVRGCAGLVQIVDPDSGAMIRSYPRATAERILIDASCFEGDSTDRVTRPVPLGAMARKLAELAQQGVQQRSVDLYAALAEVAR